ncbi:uncharacterized protein ARMOST_07491 [Armillaria ostoyae]|uniref:Uncharacterized protein n=1 Tax=Armillaria ostoyae TaxID=47428 RepID=A0A284R5Y5_ARMOS|nr:uncharacterized protein ARMOST_07491 [Armillaria ostoyae]
MSVVSYSADASPSDEMVAPLLASPLTLSTASLPGGPESSVGNSAIDSASVVHTQWIASIEDPPSRSGSVSFFSDTTSVYSEDEGSDAQVLSYGPILCAPDPVDYVIATQSTKLPQEMLDIIVALACTDGCVADAVFSILPSLTAKRLAVTAHFQQPIEMWEEVLTMNSVIPMAVHSVELVAFEEADMAKLASFIPKVQQVEFIRILSPILIPFRAIHVDGSTYNDSKIGMLFHLSPKLSELHVGGSQVSSFTGVTLSEDIPTSKCVVHDDSSPIHKISYNAEKGVHFLLEHPGFSSRIQPRMTMLHSLFIRTDYQAFDFVQNIVSASRDTLQIIDVILSNWPARLAPKNLCLSGCRVAVTLGLGQESSSLAVLNSTLLSHPCDNAVTQITLSVFTESIWKRAPWLELARILGFDMHFSSLEVLHVNVYAMGLKRATDSDVYEMLNAARSILTPEKMGFRVVINRRFKDRRIAF